MISKNARFYFSKFSRTNLQKQVKPHYFYQIFSKSAQQTAYPTQKTEMIDGKYWYPKDKTELDLFPKDDLIDLEILIETSNPYFEDMEYRKRRNELVAPFENYKITDPHIPHIEYSEKENFVWETILKHLIPLHEKHACSEYLHNFRELEKEGLYSRKEIPQMEKVSKYIYEKSELSLKPVAGMINQRQFLNGLAYRVFPCTSYIRHEKTPFYTPEPDMIHEYIGHVPLLANRDFCDFSQQIGLASLGAPDDVIAKLGNIYLFTIEFGLCIQNGEMKVYGAGPLGSVEEITKLYAGVPKIKPFNLDEMANEHCYLTKTQEVMYISNSFVEARDLFIKYAESLIKKN